MVSNRTALSQLRLATPQRYNMFHSWLVSIFSAPRAFSRYCYTEACTAELQGYVGKACMSRLVVWEYFLDAVFDHIAQGTRTTTNPPQPAPSISPPPPAIAMKSSRRPTRRKQHLAAYILLRMSVYNRAAYRYTRTATDKGGQVLLPRCRPPSYAMPDTGLNLQCVYPTTAVEVESSG